MKPIPLHPNLPTPTTTFGNPTSIAQYYICPHCNNQSPLVKEWIGLTDEERKECIDWAIDLDSTTYSKDLSKMIEHKLKEKNT